VSLKLPIGDPADWKPRQLDHAVHRLIMALPTREVPQYTRYIRPVACAEIRLAELGLKAAYGSALARRCLSPDPGADRQGRRKLSAEQCAQLAMASPRVRAEAAAEVIMAHQAAQAQATGRKTRNSQRESSQRHSSQGNSSKTGTPPDTHGGEERSDPVRLKRRSPARLAAAGKEEHQGSKD